MFLLKSKELVDISLVRTRRAKSYRERWKLAKAARKGSINGSGKYREKRRDSIEAKI
ncbi:MAG: hypothetical protein AB1351_11085 [Thermoproteota archaeon]